MTTPDPATLREALDDWTTDSPPPWQVKATVINAARWALDLIEGGKRRWVCDNEGGDLDNDCILINDEKLGEGAHQGCGWKILVTP